MTDNEMLDKNTHYYAYLYNFYEPHSFVGISYGFLKVYSYNIEM